MVTISTLVSQLYETWDITAELSMLTKPKHKLTFVTLCWKTRVAHLATGVNHFKFHLYVCDKNHSEMLNTSTHTQHDGLYVGCEVIMETTI